MFDPTFYMFYGLDRDGFVPRWFMDLYMSFMLIYDISSLIWSCKMFQHTGFRDNPVASCYSIPCFYVP